MNLRENVVCCSVIVGARLVHGSWKGFGADTSFAISLGKTKISPRFLGTRSVLNSSFEIYRMFFPMTWVIDGVVRTGDKNLHN